MNYGHHYARLIWRAQNRLPVTGHVERHHIVPRCMGGGNEPANIAVLTPGEHFFAHMLLAKMYPDRGGIVLAALRMSRGRYGKATTYGRLRKKYADVNKPHSAEALEKIAASARGRVWSDKQRKQTAERMRGNKRTVGRTFVRSAETCMKLSARFKGRIFTPEWCAKISAGRRGKCVRGPKLSRQDVIDIRQSKTPRAELASQYSVGESYIRRVQNNEVWRSVAATA